MAGRTTALSSALAMNVALLWQGAELLERIDDTQYTRGDALTPGGGIGRHVRHCLEFYACFLRGLPLERIDYVHRERGGKVETDRTSALGEVRAIIAALERLDGAAVDAVLAVRSEEYGEGVEDWTASTPAREAQFLASHTTHHFAVVAILLRSAGIEPPAELGVAPSTLRHWERAAS